MAAERGDLGEGAVAAVALAAEDAGPAGALAGGGVAGAAEGAVREAVAGQAGVLARGLVVVLLRTPGARGAVGAADSSRPPGRGPSSSR